MKAHLVLLSFFCLFSAVLAQPRSTRGLDGVIVHVEFAHDRGDVLDSVEYKGIKYDPSRAANSLIPRLGWKDESKRGDIAWAWVTQVCLVGNTLLKECPEDFKQREIEFETPKVHNFDDGSVEIVLWYREPVGMVPETRYAKRRFKFSSGGMLFVEALDDVTIP